MEHFRTIRKPNFRGLHCDKLRKYEQCITEVNNRPHTEYAKCYCERCYLGKFHGAVGRNDKNAVQNIIDKNPEIINTPLRTNSCYLVQTAIFKAIQKKRYRCAEFLIENGANLNAVCYSSETGEIYGTPLFLGILDNDMPIELLTTLIINSDLSYTCTETCQTRRKGFESYWLGTNIYHIIIKSVFQRNQHIRYIMDLVTQEFKKGRLAPDINKHTNILVPAIFYAVSLNGPKYLIDFLINHGADIWLNIDSENNFHRKSNIYLNIMKLRDTELVRLSSLIRNFGLQPNKQKTMWNRLPDELWREIITFII